MCPSAPRVCSEPGGQKPVLSFSLDLIENKSALVQVMAWRLTMNQCHSMNQCWPSSLRHTCGTDGDELKYSKQTPHSSSVWEWGMGCFFCLLITSHVLLYSPNSAACCVHFYEFKLRPLLLYCKIICKSCEIGPCDNFYVNHLLLDHVIYISAYLVMLNNEITTPGYITLLILLTGHGRHPIFCCVTHKPTKKIWLQNPMCSSKYDELYNSSYDTSV